MALTAASPATSSEKNYPGIMNFLHRNRYLIAGAGLFVTFWMLVYTFAVYRPVYAAKSVVIIKDSAITSRYVETEQYYALQTTSSNSSNPVLNTMGILKSGAISDALYVYFQQKRPDELRRNKIKSKADWVKFFQDGSAFIKAKNQPGTDLIEIQFSWRDPVVAKEALAVVTKAFQDASRDLNKQEQISRTKFLHQQVLEIEGQLAEIRKQKSDYQSKQGTVNVEREGNDLAGTRMDLQNRLNQLESQARGKENLARRYQQMLGMSPDKALKATALGQNGTLSKLQDELYRLEQQHSQLSSSLTDTNPKVVEIKVQIEQVKTNIDAEKARTMSKTAAGDTGVVADPNRAKLVDSMLTAQAEAQDLRTQASVIRGRLGQVSSQIRSFPTLAEGLTNIAQKEASLSTALDNLRKKALEGKLKEEQTLSNVFVVDAPRLPDRPQFPNRNHLLILSLMLGVGAGLAAAVGKEQLLSGNLTLPAWMEPMDGKEKDASVAATHPAFVNVSQLGIHHPASDHAEKVELPATGSLLDALIPVAGPIMKQTALRQPTDRIVLRNGNSAGNGNGYAGAYTVNGKSNGNGKRTIEQVALLMSDSDQETQTVVPPMAQTVPPVQADVPAGPVAMPAEASAPKTMTPKEAAISMALAQQAAPVIHPEVMTEAELELLEDADEADDDFALYESEDDFVDYNSDDLDSKGFEPAEPYVIEAAAPEALQTTYDEAANDDYLLPPAAPVNEKPRIRQAAPVAPELADRLKAIAKKEIRPVKGVPSLHSVPAAENQMAIQAEAPQQAATEQRLSLEEMVNRIQEAPAAEAAPVERKRRGIPSFLLAEEKQVLESTDNLMANVAPMSAPADEATLAEQRIEAPTYLARREKKRDPLKGSILWFRKQPGKHPESYFGMDRHGGKLKDAPSGLNQWKQSLESGPHAG